jgi:predicted DNA-binding transcriptional regulator AlpA
MPEILTIDILADFLHMTRRQIYEMTSKRGQSAAHPLPLLRVNGNIRFRRDDVEQWLATLARREAA